MKPIRSSILLFLLFFSLSLTAQRVYYKGNHYSLVNSKIFHLGHNVYGKLTQGERDTLYMIARELYNDKGKMKPHYRARRKRDRYKLPDGYWEQKNAKVAERSDEIVPIVAEVVNKNERQQAFAEAETNEKTEKLKNDKEPSIKEAIQDTPKTVKKEQSDQKIKEDKEVKAQKEKAAAKEKQRLAQDKVEKKDEKKREKENKLVKAEKERKEEKVDRREEKEQKKAAHRQQQAEKEQKKKEKKLKAKEKAIINHKEAKKKLKKTEEKYQKLKELGELSPNDEAEWLEKIEKLKEKLAKAEKKVD